MAEKRPRRKLFKVAKELNLAHQTIIEFLEKKGYKVSGLNTPITDEIYDEILKRFSQEKVKAEKLEKRRREKAREEVLAEIEQESEQSTVVSESKIVSKKAEEVKAEETSKVEVPVSTEEKTVSTAEEEVGVQKETPEIISKKTATKKQTTEISQETEIEAEAISDTENLAKTEEIKEKSTEESTATKVSEKDQEETEVKVSEEVSFIPKIGDIIDHPAAKRFLELEKEREKKKAEKKKKRLEKIRERDKAKKKGKEKDKEKDKEKEKEKEKFDIEVKKEKVTTEKIPEKEIIPRRIRALEKEEIQEVPVIEEEFIKIEKEERAKRKKKKKQIDESLSEKERRRRKALEMIRKESRKGKLKIPLLDDTLEEEVIEREGRKKRSRKKKEIDQQEVNNTLKKTLASMQESGSGRVKRKKVKTTEEEVTEDENVISVTEFITVQDLANLMDVPVNEVIKKCLELGQLVTINQRLDMDMIKLLAEDFGFKVQEEEEFASDYIEDILKEESEESPEKLEPRHPVVTVMGHVDHGKTSLLDYIRNTNVVAGESGGITQHIGAYVVDLEDGRRITFLDTPGHEAFTAMRSRGAHVTDIVVLVIAADDRVMPQTEEAIDHAFAAGVPIVIAINKIDKPDADPQAIRKQLAERNILVEDWGGKYQVAEVSAKTGEGISDLLEKILLEAELLELKANPNRRATGVVIESRLDKGKGPVATVLIQQGTLKIGDDFIVGQYYGRVRALLNERNQRVQEARPAFPVQVLGIDGVPEAGDKLIVMPNERIAKEIASRRQQLKREQDFRQIRLLTLDEISRQIKEGEVKELNILVKADVDGSAQALTDALLKLNNDNVAVKVIRRAVGPISESDVMLAAASKAIIIGFHIRPTLKAKELAETENVDIRLYKVIYDAIEDVKLALEGLLEPEKRENVIGVAEIREVFKISRLGNVAGCYVLNGKITRNARIRLIRNDVEIYEGRLASLKRFKEDVKEVVSGYECGLMIENYNDIKVGDYIEAFEIIEEKRSLNT